MQNSNCTIKLTTKYHMFRMYTTSYCNRTISSSIFSNSNKQPTFYFI